MYHLERKHKQIQDFCKQNGKPEIIAKYSRYFKEGYDAYGLEYKTYTDQAGKWMEEWNSEMTLKDYLSLGDLLMATGKYEEASYAIHFVMEKKEEWTKQTFQHMGLWLENNITNWAHTDVMCMAVLFGMLQQKVVAYSDFEPWRDAPSLWKRRAVPVTFVEAIKKKYDPKPILEVIDPLMEDPEADVQKGLGTLLREIWKKQPQLAEEFLMKWKNTCGRKIVQYATEKMDKEYRKKFRKEK